MTAPIISVRNLTKSYNLYSQPSDRLKEALWPYRKRHTVFQALHDVSFDVFPGEHIGIVGMNGAGKSTLLQIITGVLTPTSGSVSVSGQVAALLELGAGFNPELSGRENVIFQMQLAGIPEKLLPDKLEEVQAFADVGDFFEQPAKLYSSGMFARVAFASAILTEPEILIVDEALAVGDARFQKKCNDRMARMRESGATILLVSHDVYGVKASSSRMLLLHHGELLQNGAPEDVAATFLDMLFVPEANGNGSARTTPQVAVENVEVRSAAEPDEYVLHVAPKEVTNTWGHGGIVCTGVRFTGLVPPNGFIPGQEFCMEQDFIIDRKKLFKLAEEYHIAPVLYPGLRIDNLKSLPICAFPGSDKSCGFDITTIPDTFTAKMTLTLPFLAAGEYFFSPGVMFGNKAGTDIPLLSLENLTPLRCTHDEAVHGIVKIAGKIERVE